MSEAALEEIAALSSIYCGEGEYQLIHESGVDGLVVQIKTAVGHDARRAEVSLSFHLPPLYPLCPPNVSVSSPLLSRGQCQDLRQKLQEQAAALPKEPMVHQLVAWLQQSGEVAKEGRGAAATEQVQATSGGGGGEEWMAVLTLDHIRSRGRYVKQLKRWTEQLQLRTWLLLGHHIVIVLQGTQADIQEFCSLLKTAKVDVNCLGRKCRERMMKVLMQSPSLSPSPEPRLELHGHHTNRPAFLVLEYQSMSELVAAFQEIDAAELYRQIQTALTT